MSDAAFAFLVELTDAVPTALTAAGARVVAALVGSVAFGEPPTYWNGGGAWCIAGTTELTNAQLCDLIDVSDVSVIVEGGAPEPIVDADASARAAAAEEPAAETASVD